MGLDIQKLIAAAEAKIYGDKKGADGKLNTAEEESIFKGLLQEKVENQTDYDDIINIMGLERTPQAEKNAGTRQNHTRKASGEGGGINIYVNNSIDLKLNIKIDAKINEIIQELLQKIEELQNNNEKVINEAVNKLIENLNNNQNAIEEFIVALFKEYRQNPDYDFSKIEAVLEQILTKLSEVSGQVDQQTEVINKLRSDVMGLMEQTYNTLKMMGLNTDAILEAVKQGNLKEDEQIALLGKIYDAIMNLTGQFKDFTAEEKEQFNQVINMLQEGKVNVEDIVALLQAIQNDTSENKEISKAILNEIQNLGTEFNAAISEILAKIGEGNDNSETIKQLLTQILAQAEKISAENKENFAAVLEAIKNIPAGGNVDLDKIATLLNEIRNLTAANGEKLDGVITNEETIITILKSIVDKLGDEHKDITGILNQIIVAINNHECDCCDVDAEALMTILQQILEKCGCHCNCGKNEGIVDDWDGDYGDLLGSLAKVRGMFNEDATGVGSVQAGANNHDGKFVDPKTGNILVRRGGIVYDLSGKPVRQN